MAVERTQGRTFDLERLLAGIDSGAVVLPEFQRDFRWGPAEVSSLLATVLAGWPLGSLLVIPQSPRQRFATRTFVDAPDATRSAEWVVLDGQQRLTSLYHALYGLGDNVYSVRLDLDPSDPIEGLEQAIEVLPRRTWERRYPTPRRQYASNRVPVAALREAADFFAWRDAATDSEEGRDSLAQLYRRTLSGLQLYSIPAVVVDEDLPTQAIARVFERVNRQGMPLSTFDLMVAITFHDGFNLRDAWAELMREHPRANSFLEGDGMPVLSMLAMQNSRDLRQKAVLSLPAEFVRSELRSAVRAMDEAAVYAQRHLGALRSSALPYPAMLPVLGSLAWAGMLRTKDRVIQNWYWSSAFSLRFAVAANTRAVSDFEAIRDAEFEPVSRVLVRRTDYLESARRKNAGMHRTIMCAAAAARPLIDVTTSRAIDYEREDLSAFVEVSLAPLRSEYARRTHSMIWAEPSQKRALEGNPGMCDVAALASQHGSPLSDQGLEWEARLVDRAQQLRQAVEGIAELTIQLVDEFPDDSEADGEEPVAQT